MEKDLILWLLFGVELLGLLLWAFTRLANDLTSFLGSWGRLRSVWRRQGRPQDDPQEEKQQDEH